MSRKLLLLYIVLGTATVGLVIPPTLVWVFTFIGKKPPAFNIFSSTEWVTIVTLLVSTYFGSNIAEKHVALSNGVLPTALDDTVKAIKNPELANSASQDDNTTEPAVDPEKQALREALRHGK